MMRSLRHSTASSAPFGARTTEACRITPIAAQIAAANIPVYDGPRSSSAPGRAREIMAEMEPRLSCRGRGSSREARLSDVALVDAGDRALSAIIAEGRGGQRPKGRSLRGSGQQPGLGTPTRSWPMVTAPESCSCATTPTRSCGRWQRPGSAPATNHDALSNVVRTRAAKAQDAHRGLPHGLSGRRDPARISLLATCAVGPCLTLQGAGAHSDIPVGRGPTKLLPY